jgi:hypothetical protein
MSLKLEFRVVGMYLQFKDLDFPSLQPNSTVREIMTSIVGLNRGFTFDAGPTPGGKDIVSSMTYDYPSGSTPPPNASGTPDAGPRTLDNRLEIDVSRVWQYYRGAKVKIAENVVVDVEFPTVGQPSFTTLSLNDGNPLPADMPIIAYSLTWRLVTIDRLPERRRLDLDSALRRAVADR